MDRKRRVFLVHCLLCSIAVICVILLISFIFDRRLHIDNNKSLSDDDYNTNHYSSNVDGIPESRWKTNDDVIHHRQHGEFPFSNGMYLGKNDENYLIIEDENIEQIDHYKRAKVKEVISYKRQYIKKC